MYDTNRTGYTGARILEACKGTAMTSEEIRRFYRLVWNAEISNAIVFYTIGMFAEKVDTDPGRPFLNRTTGIDYIVRYRRGKRPDENILWPDTTGYLTDEGGVRRLKRDTLPQRNPMWGQSNPLVPDT